MLAVVVLLRLWLLLRLADRGTVGRCNSRGCCCFPAGQPQGAPLSVQVTGLVVFPWAVKSIDWVAPAGIVGG